LRRAIEIDDKLPIVLLDFYAASDCDLISRCEQVVTLASDLPNL